MFKLIVETLYHFTCIHCDAEFTMVLKQYTYGSWLSCPKCAHHSNIINESKEGS